jgi:thioredoxin-dependent peroxiredoxin
MKRGLADWLGALLIAAALVGCGDSATRVSKTDLRNKKEIAMAEQTRTVTMKGNPLTLTGKAVKAGDPAPDFTAVANDLSEFRLSSLKGKVVIIASVPSLDTSVCSLETRRFNQEAAALGDDVRIVTVSMDLPFAQKRWCGAEGVSRLQTVSDHRDAAFGQSYGVLIKELRLLARAVFVIDRKGTIQYIEIVPELTHEPNYDAALTAARKLVGV